METQTLNVIDFDTRGRLGTIQADVFRADKLLHSAGSYGWRVRECLDERGEQRHTIHTPCSLASVFAGLMVARKPTVILQKRIAQCSRDCYDR